ncbi:MAG: imidazole glycerol phosphate synthase subunit HisH [Akkermansiaceae bacterium]|jgi:imidazole glycerol phosphate synthase glutamine amidotransferase subunit|nr:imidazole glycerol phosphate synthase subunit HisH [Akkermansiaceae bacterium]|tara:strand:+ start:627 stop:1247 length:621 start_codon:yes stop_codon:yes gene_type:complete
MTVGVVDYGGGNIRSLVKALEALGVTPQLLSSAEGFDDCRLLVFPGQGAFGDCMKKLEERELVEPLKAWLAADRPFFGICVGYQLLFESSEESPGQPGLGIFQGTVRHFPDSGLKVPHMGWNSAELNVPESTPWEGLGPAPYFYYVHSYFPVPEDPSLIAAETEYGTRFAAAVQRGNVVATQFHPEKSQKAGMRLLGNFLRDNGAI